MSQTAVFRATEADAYFRRNLEECATVSTQQIPRNVALYSQYVQSHHKILEVGCAAGRNLHLLRQLTGCTAFGLEPSQEAVRSGASLFPDISVSVGTAERLEFPDDAFDFVLFGFVLCWIDRDLLPRVVFEADRVLKSGGFLGITDFDADVPTSRPYKHQEGLVSCKLDYSRLFTAFPQYVLVEKISHSHHGESFHPDPQERLSSVVLYKDLTAGYARG